MLASKKEALPPRWMNMPPSIRPKRAAVQLPVGTVLHPGDYVKQEKQTSILEDMPTEKDVPFLLFFVALFCMLY